MTKEEALTEAQKIAADFEATEAPPLKDGDPVRCILGKMTKVGEADRFVAYGMGNSWDDALASLQKHMTFLDGIVAREKAQQDKEAEDQKKIEDAVAAGKALTEAEASKPVTRNPAREVGSPVAREVDGQADDGK